MPYEPVQELGFKGQVVDLFMPVTHNTGMTDHNMLVPTDPTGQSLVLSSSIDEAERRKFQAWADQWWDPNGPFKSLHDLNVVRMAAIIEALKRRWPRDGERPLEGLRILDVGCGGGLAAEPLARLGAEVTGIDVVDKNIKVAQLHAENAGLNIDYRIDTVEATAARGESYDVVLALEVVEHVADFPGFVGALARATHPGGQLFIGTLNRTILSYLVAIIGGEYILRKLPVGTHNWKRFRRPEEIHTILHRHGVTIERLQGMTYNPLRRPQWRLSGDVSVNYLMRATRVIPE